MSRGSVPKAGPATKRPYFLPTDYPDPRSAAEVEADRATVRRQVEVLGSAHDELDRIITRLQVRQTDAPNALPFYRYQPDGAPASGAPALAARDQLVVKVGGDNGVASARTGVIDAARALGYHPIRHAVDELSVSDVEVVVGPEKSAIELAADVKILRDSGIAAALHLVVPLGHIVKGDDYPSKTALSERRRPAPRAFPRDPDAKVRIAVIDTGMASEVRDDGFLVTVPRTPEHEDRLDILPAPSGNERLDWCNGHGTFAAGIVQLVAPGAEIFVYRFTRGDGLGTEKDVADMLIRAVEDAVRDGIRLIINASLGTPAADGVPPVVLGNAVERINREFPDVLIVASAGNTGTTDKMYPAAFDRVVAVGALTADGTGAAFSNHGDWLDCSAVGVGVMSMFVQGKLPPEDHTALPDVDFPKNSLANWSGTSFSAPQISGAVARRCLEDASISPQQAIDELLDGQEVVAEYGRAVRLLPGTPT